MPTASYVLCLRFVSLKLIRKYNLVLREAKYVLCVYVVSKASSKPCPMLVAPYNAK